MNSRQVFQRVTGLKMQEESLLHRLRGVSSRVGPRPHPQREDSHFEGGARAVGPYCWLSAPMILYIGKSRQNYGG
jgi:hypothetical protein